tara:strand:- start:3110 stop:4150 length:1041 start_codon:yes stop_codon:yes gene_type:complete
MSNTIKKIYNNFVKSNFINYDDKQINALEIIYDAWQKNNKINFFFKSKKINGVYLYGSVGIGKTFLLSTFVDNIPHSKKFHFNHFMISLHAFINNAENKELALEIYIKDLAKKYKVIFIDELHIFNIVDALLVKKIFNLFKKNKLFILISSNFAPTELYKNGLQRNDFIPFINLIKNNFKVLQLNNLKDYRRLMLNQCKTYFTPINKKTINEFNSLFKKFVDKSQIHIKKIHTKSRVMRFEKCTSNIVFCDFNDLCFANLAHEDYFNFAKEFSLIFINNVPKFSESEADLCRRFINLVDMLYDQKCSLVLLAECPISQLCHIKNLQKDFKRTSSRLYEMTIMDNKK